MFPPMAVNGDVIAKRPVPTTVHVSQKGLNNTKSATIAVADAFCALSQHGSAITCEANPARRHTDNKIVKNILVVF